MPKILVRIADEKLRDEIVSALSAAGKKNVVVTEGPITQQDDPHETAKNLVNSRAAVVVLDYISDDAASVKLLQSTTDSAPTPHFIFIMPDELGISHILMAVNEGASAMIERPVKMPALVNYVERAITGPGRLRHESMHAAVSGEDSIAEFEKHIRILRQHNTACQKLIVYMLATPMEEQTRKVLLVSDSAYQRDILKKMLEAHFFSVLTANSAKDGLEAALSEKPLIVVSDLEMEGQNGIEFCHSLKSEHKFVPCHFIICTANSEKLETIMSPGNGVDDCTLKPANENDYKEFMTRVALGLLLKGGVEEVEVATPSPHRQ